MAYTSDLVADKVTAGLKAKLLENVWRKPTEFGYHVYVNADTGNDTTGTGSQDAPFATVKHAIAWLFDNYHGRPNSTIVIDIQSDIDESNGAFYVQYHPYYLKITANGHNVKLGRFYIRNSIVIFDGVTFCHQSAHRCIGCVMSRVQLDNCSYESLIEGMHTFTPFYISCASYASINGLTANNTYSGPTFFMCSLNSILGMVGALSLTATNVTNTPFMTVTEQSEISYAATDGTVTWPGRKYQVEASALILTANKGEDYLPGEQPGVIADEQFSQVY